MEHRIPASDPVRNRLTMQNEILKKVEGLAQRMQSRAEEVTREVRDLEDRAGAAERDLSGAIGAFRRLSDTHFVENQSCCVQYGHNISHNTSRVLDSSFSPICRLDPLSLFDPLPVGEDLVYKAIQIGWHESKSGCLQPSSRMISEEKENSRARDFSKTSVGESIPAQSYEMDILPRYKEALSLGLASFNDHKKKDKRFTARSPFNPLSVRGPLPHIIGSEEFIHDNSCGLIDDLAFGPSLDLSDMAESKELFAADAEPADLFNTNLFGLEKGQSDDNQSEPLVSAALDFKAMLEAALRSPYKFYDEDSSSHAMGSESSLAAHPDLSGLMSGGLFDSEEAGNRAEVEGPAGGDPATSAISLDGLPEDSGPPGPTGGGSPDAGEEDLQRKEESSRLSRGM